MIFPKSLQPEADHEHTGMGQQGDGIKRVFELWICICWQAGQHILRQRQGAKYVSDVDRHCELV